jgi:hypothetical protein
MIGLKEAECILSTTCSEAACQSEANTTLSQEENERAEESDEEKGKKSDQRRRRRMHSVVSLLCGRHAVGSASDTVSGR